MYLCTICSVFVNSSRSNFELSCWTIENNLFWVGQLKRCWGKHCYQVFPNSWEVVYIEFDILFREVREFVGDVCRVPNNIDPRILWPFSDLDKIYLHSEKKSFFRQLKQHCLLNQHKTKQRSISRIWVHTTNCEKSCFSFCYSSSDWTIYRSKRNGFWIDMPVHSKKWKSKHSGQQY